MKYLTALIAFLVINLPVSGQSVTVSVANEHAGFTSRQIPLQSGVATLTGNRFTVGDHAVSQPLTWSVSPSGNKIGVISAGGRTAYQVLDANGNTLSDTELEFFDNSDSSIAIFQFNDGRAAARDNIANFTFFDAAGTQRFSISNSSQSRDGEQISELASDAAGKTIVLYNPVISFGSATGSRAQLVFGEDDTDVFFRSSEREIKQLKVTDDGSFITVLTTGGNNDYVHVFDRFGNELYNSELDNGRAGVTLSGKGEFLTVYGEGRVQVFNINTNQSVGSSSSRTPLLYGIYIPEDETIIAVGGNRTGESVSNASLVAVHVGKRQIARSNLPGSPILRNPNEISIQRNSSSRYRLKGLHQHFNISTSF